jgi:hypothetical protein
MQAIPQAPSIGQRPSSGGAARPELALSSEGMLLVMRMDAIHLLYIHAHPGKAFCASCLERLSRNENLAQAASAVGKSFKEGEAQCSSCGNVGTVYMS